MNYMKQFIELSKEYKKNNKSRRIIAKIVEFMSILEKENSRENKLILTNVYTILGFHKKAFDLHMEIYDKNNQKENKKLYVMEQKAKYLEDKFAVKLNQKAVIEIKEKNNYIPENFIRKEKFEGLNLYELNKDCVIFNKIFDVQPLKIIFKEENEELFGHLSKINECIFWLGGNCKQELIKYYNQNLEMLGTDEADDEWYENLKINGVIIEVLKNGKLFTNIGFSDPYLPYIPYQVEIIENKICSINWFSVL